MPYIGNVLTSFAVETGNIADQAVTAPKLSATGGTNGQVLALDAGGNLVWTSDPAGQWVTSGSNIYFTGGSVGIGTNSPGSLLDLAGGDIRLNSVYGINKSNSDGYIHLSGGTSNVLGGTIFCFGQSHVSNANEIHFRNSGNQTRAVIDSSGRLGLGTSSPSANGKLTVANTDQQGICFVNTDSSNKEWRIAGASTSLAVIQSGVGEALRVDSGNRLLVGTASSIANVYVGGSSYQSPLQVVGNTAGYGNGLTSLNYSSGGYAATLTLGSSKNATVGNNGAVASGDDLGILNFVGNDGTNFRTGAYIIATAAGTVATGDVPTRLTFWTKQSGVAGPTEVMRISPTQKVGIGSSADPTYKLNIYCNEDDGLEIYDVSSGNNRRLRILQTANGAVYNATYSLNGNAHLWQIGNSEVARIDVNGNFLVATAAMYSTSLFYDGRCRIAGNTILGSLLTCGRSGGDYDGIGYNVGWQGTSGQFKYVVTDTAAYIKFGGNSGRIETYTAAGGTSGNSISFTTGPYVAQGGTSWTSSSDERLKEDLLPIEDGFAKIASLRAVTGRFKTDDSSKRRSFLIAQDVQKVLPEAVDTVDPEALGLDYIAVIPLLVAALKESKERIEQLEAKVAALESV